MPRPIFTLKNTSIALALLIVDVLIYGYLALMLMDYEDNYDVSKGAYWSWESMTPTQRIYSTTFEFWGVLNIIVFIWLLCRMGIYLQQKRPD